MSSSLLLAAFSSLLLAHALFMIAWSPRLTNRGVTMSREEPQQAPLTADRPSPPTRSSWTLWLALAGSISGGYAAGALGALVLGSLVLFLARWRKVQVVTSFALIPIVFIAGSVVRTEHIRRNVVDQEAWQPIHTATAQRTTMQQKAVEAIAAQDAANPTPAMTAAECAQFAIDYPGTANLPCNQSDPVPAASGDDWDRVASAFEQSHPDLKLGNNYAIMQDAVNMLAKPGMRTDEVLAKSYTAATLTTGWTSPPASVAANINQIAWDEAAAAPTPVQHPTPPPTLLQVVVQDAQNCQANGGNPMNCYSNASPDRCKAAAVAMVGDPELNRRTWGLCVQSCVGAGLWSRTVGDCRR